MKIGHAILRFDEIDSTNNYAKSNANMLEDGTVIIAGKQTLGRGRMGRNWVSDQGAGIWMSVLLKPKINVQKIPLISFLACSAVVKAIKEIYPCNIGIKWPNDIVWGNRKLGGILCETEILEDRAQFVIVGMGINTNQNEFSPEISKVAVSLKQIEGIDTNHTKLIDLILRNLQIGYELLKREDEESIVNEWRTHSVTLGKEVEFSYDNAKMTGKAIDVTNDGELIIDTVEKTKIKLKYGEISIRGVSDYV